MSSKVFVGNLSFKTETEALREHFSAAGTVTEANIITRGPRSLGYGFVDFKTPADAENAVKLFNQKEIDGRVVNVEVAHPRQEESAANGGEKAAAAGAADGTRPPRARRGRGGRPQTAEGEGAPQPREGGRRFRPRQTDGAEGAEGEAVEGGRRRGYSGAATGAPRGTGFAPRGRGGARRGAPRTNPDGTPVAAGAPGSPKPAGERAPRPFRERKPREPQAPRPQRPKEQSETTLFVANLPFAVTDAELAEIFAGLKVTKAHVVVKRNGKSKGFGFVEFANQEDQLAALKAKDGEVYQERPLNVKVALVQAVADAAAAAAEAEKPAEGAEAAAAPAATTTTETKEEKAAEPKAAETSA
jgi:RNA recognition motif-containing protein